MLHVALSKKNEVNRSCWFLRHTFLGGLAREPPKNSRESNVGEKTFPPLFLKMGEQNLVIISAWLKIMISLYFSQAFMQQMV